MAQVRILYIEGSDAQRRELAEHLSSRGFAVCEKPSGSEGLEAIRSGPFDVVLCDLHMPGVDGMEVLEQASRTAPDLPIIMLTTHASISEAVNAVQKGAYRFLAKPVNRDELEVTIHQAIEHARLHRWLRQADEQLRLLVETTPLPYIISRVSDGRILYANRHLADLVGLTTEELKKRNTTDFYYHSEERQVVLQKLKDTGLLRDHELQLKNAQGEPIWATLSVATMELAGEAVVLGGVHDITKRKQIEDALLTERNFVSTILDTAGALVVVTDPEGRFVRFNRACEEITGYRFDEVRGRTFYDLFILPEEKERVRERFEQIRTGPWPVKGENRWYSKHGEARLIDWSNTALMSEEGDLEHIVAIGIDITERRKAEEKLRLYREIFMNSIDVITVLDQEGRIIERNPAHERKSGFTDDEVIGKKTGHFFEREQVAKITEALAEQGSYRGEALGQTKDGTPIWIDLSIFPIADKTGEATCYVGMGRDVTETKMTLADLAVTNQELRDAQAQLVQSEKMASLGSLVAGIAHEINTPVGAIGSMHDTLRRAVAKLKQHLETTLPGTVEGDRKLQGIFEIIQNANQVIESGCSRVAEIVRRLRSFARLDEAEIKKVNIHEGLEDTLILLHHEIKHNVTVIKNFGEVPPIAVYPGRLNQVFLNILNNARQAIEDKGEITITTYVADQKAHVVISDNGVGISQENFKNIFDPGFTTKGVGVGTGLGLSICYQIIQEHQGDIKVQSEMGKGSSFHIILPMNLDERLGVS